MFRILGPDPADCGVVTAVVDDEEDQSPSIAFEALRLNCSRKLSICTSMELGVLAISFRSFQSQLTTARCSGRLLHSIDTLPLPFRTEPRIAHVFAYAHSPFLRIGLLQFCNIFFGTLSGIRHLLLIALCTSLLHFLALPFDITPRISSSFIEAHSFEATHTIISAYFSIFFPHSTDKIAFRWIALCFSNHHPRCILRLPSFSLLRCGGL